MGALLTRVRVQLAGLGVEPALVLGLVGVGLLAHGLNMFNYPAFTFKDDEGIYAGQAWAVLREARLTPYTYWYDHAPAGWILVAAWMAATGGPERFGGAIDSGRLLMLLLHLGMVPLLYRLARRLGCGRAAASFAALLFSISPLAVFYQRMLLLDSIMLFWLLLSLDLLLDGWGRLSRLVASGVCLGVAILSKETALFLAPGLAFIAWQQRREHQGRFGGVVWLVSALLVVSWYPLYAALKGELLPAGLALRFALFSIEAGPGVSLVDALRWQSARSGGGLLNLDNLFWQLARGEWLPRDPVLFAGGALASGANLLRGVRDRRALAAGLLGALPLAYLARGGVVFDYYVVAAVPFLCLNLAVLAAPALRRLPRPSAGVLVAVASVVLVVGYWRAGTLLPLYTQRPGDAGREALAWIRRHVPPQSRLISRDDLWTDLREGGAGGPAFPNVHSHWKVAGDPAIRGGVFHDDWRTVDYLIMSPGLEAAFVDTGDTVALEALRHAHLVRRWESGDSIVELWKVDKPGPTETALLADGAAAMSARFERGGAYQDSGGVVTSEAQAYALLRAVWSGDRAEFERVWGWTRANLLNPDGLLAWQWRDGAVVDGQSAADADTDAALALLLASRRWNDSHVRDDGVRLVRAIWQHEVVEVDGAPYLTAGAWAASGEVLALNPSYFAPYAYHVFAEVDRQHNWLGLVDSSYRVLFDASEATLGASRSAGLPPDWVGLDRRGGQLVPLMLGPGSDTTRYGYDATRAYWRVALDWRWSHDGRAEAFLRQAGFLRDEVRRAGAVGAVYARDGAEVERAPSMVGTAGALAALLTLDPDAANRLYAGQVVGGARRTAAGVSWGSPDDLYAQEWAWFGVGLYADALANLWQAPPQAAEPNPVSLGGSP